METGFIGIDTVALRFPLADVELDDPRWVRQEAYRTARGTTAPARARLTLPLPGGAARLAVTELPGEWLGTVELEVPGSTTAREGCAQPLRHVLP